MAAQSTTAQLLAKHSNIFKKATEHELTKQLCKGTLADRALYIYLAQDLQFFETGLRTICKTTAKAPEVDSLLTLAKKIGFFANDENTYFRDCLELLAPAMTKEEIEFYNNNEVASVKQYIAYLNKLTNDNSIEYPQLITYLWVAEQIYLEWAHNLPKAENLHWKYQTWIDLHDGKHFIDWCDFLKAEVDKYPIEKVEETFVEVTSLEFEFFESCFNAK
ncbi:hypothetical protein TBLA_0A01320 [Henningerozyma blattae CBS 6284]|uniref:Thiaminase-2/PQQC domain-containing protein n=1 Tax=Henningerozyma blattae (strain ATCC 34711 / CBS 6284 / DSM 70876 / NBRC 10599 / NRRL Y-10934 / UCD 77-7) TaxID=1071380 RepID=I2GUX9_HENB6|nr:hypothetical protein TBLA_0A01320 [Tetrapisispora blattae CBS 6284]CCH57931.1 hypothetical protein TBLA_0A01320 [Tetrapisispora blattae CBS 6284]